MTDIFKKLLRSRGLDEGFLHPKYDDLFDPFELRGVKEAVDRIEFARNNNEMIVIYGDYDADGVSSSTLMKDALKSFGCDKVKIILPNRFTDGYGMNLPMVDSIVHSGAKLVITVDCGSGSEETILALKNRGIDTVVTDHHEIPEVPESAVAVVNPKQDKNGVGRRMAGVGVAFTLARALNMKKNGGKCDGQEKWLLDLVIIGTICDSMELRGENRILSYYGMKVLAKTRRSGLKELARVASVDLGELNAHAIGFQLGPRINAAGRMKSADLALDLMLASGRTEAFALAKELDGLNQERRKAQERAVSEVKINEDDKVIVVVGDWHEGILGIMAGRLMETYKKPAIALVELEDGRLKGSGRSFGDFSLAEALRYCPSDMGVSGGGHMSACGLSMPKESLAEFKKCINSYYCSLGLKNQEKYLRPKSDVILDGFAGVNMELFMEICLLEPFGDGNTEPIFEINATVDGVKMLKDKHLTLTLSDKKGQKMKMVAFFVSDDWKKTKLYETVRVQFTLMKNDYMGVEGVEGNIISLETIA